MLDIYSVRTIINIVTGEDTMKLHAVLLYIDD